MSEAEKLLGVAEGVGPHPPSVTPGLKTGVTAIPSGLVMEPTCSLTPLDEPIYTPPIFEAIISEICVQVEPNISVLICGVGVRASPAMSSVDGLLPQET